jgi:hypothetical protein
MTTHRLSQQDLDPASLTIVPLTPLNAAEVATWRYEPPYDFHNIKSDDAESLKPPADDGMGYCKKAGFVEERRFDDGKGHEFVELIRPVG